LQLEGEIDEDIIENIENAKNYLNIEYEDIQEIIKDNKSKEPNIPKIRPLTLYISKIRPLTLCIPKIRPLTLCILKNRPLTPHTSKTRPLTPHTARTGAIYTLHELALEDYDCNKTATNRSPSYFFFCIDVVKAI
jgi:hypothetical protein